MWDGSVQMGWLRAGGMAPCRWDGSVQVGWLCAGGMAPRRWDGSVQVGWLRAGGMAPRSAPLISFPAHAPPITSYAPRMPTPHMPPPPLTCSSHAPPSPHMPLRSHAPHMPLTSCAARLGPIIFHHPCHLPNPLVPLTPPQHLHSTNPSQPLSPTPPPSPSVPFVACVGEYVSLSCVPRSIIRPPMLASVVRPLLSSTLTFSRVFGRGDIKIVKRRDLAEVGGRVGEEKHL
ncbi:unnamed protein product [Closterium sp. NIES-65]|nr:unnamed protein product [Closterium sp. NIES-65]